MKINYQETTEDLQKRIDIHEKYGARDIDEWMLELLKPRKGDRILDVGCGAGKQCRAFHDYLEGDAQITGGDVSDELLGKAGELNRSLGEPFTLLKSGGRLFTTGPMPENKQLFYDIIREATGKPIPPMPGSSRYGSEILGAIKDLFTNVEVHIFENPLTFEDLQPFLDYTRASLSEDRLLWNHLFTGKDEFKSVLDAIQRVAEEKIDDAGELTMTKVVGGFVATK